MIVVDPRRSETVEMADIHLQVRPGTVWALTESGSGEDLVMGDAWRRGLRPMPRS
jgi:formylmethanofuran dehydrogenase subunit B